MDHQVIYQDDELQLWLKTNSNAKSYFLAQFGRQGAERGQPPSLSCSALK